MSQAFSKNQSKPSQKRQITILGMLGVALIGAWAHYGLSRTPRSAEAQTNFGDPPGAFDGDTLTKQPLDAMKELAQDPTRDLLRGNHDLGADLEKPPYNPFAVEGQWKTLLTRPVVQNTGPATEPYVEVSPRAVPRVDVDAIKLQGIVRDARQKYAIINGAIVKVGNVVGDVRIVEILDDRVLVVPISTPEAAPTEIIEKGRFK